MRALPKMPEAFADIEFTVNALLTDPKEVEACREQIRRRTACLLIHLSMAMSGLLGRSWLAETDGVFAAPYGGHDGRGRA